MLCTSMMRGFNRLVLCIMTFYGGPEGTREKYSAGVLPRRRLLRIQLDNEILVDVLCELGTIRCTLERPGQLLRVDDDPRRKANLLGQLERILNAELRLRLLGRGYDVTRAQQCRRNVLHLSVHHDRAVRDELTRLGACRSQSHPVDDVVETGFEKLQKIGAGGALALRRFREIALELPFEHAVDPPQLLLFAQLQSIVRRARARPHAVLAGFGVELAFRVEGTACALQEKVGAFSPS